MLLLSTARRLAAGFLLLPAAAGFLRASVPPAPPARLDPYFTTATRTPAEPRTLGSAIERFTYDDLARRQLTSLAGALGGATGAPAAASGGAGAVTSVFLRGANSNQALFLVDGLRLNDPNTDYAVFLGGACVSACDSLEVAHGPQSTLYGGEAVGGVVSLRAQRGAGAPSGRVAVEAGSFGTLQGALSAQGAGDAMAWNVSAQGGRTENDRPNNGFTSQNVTVRLDRRVSERAEVGGTVRWFHGVYGDPGDRYVNDPDNETRESNLLATAFASVALAPGWSAHTVLGGQDRRFVAESPRAGAATAFTVVRNRRAVLDVQSSFTGWERQRVTGGVTAEANHTRNSGFGAIDEKQGLLAVFVQDEFSPAEDVHLTAGLRNDDFDTFGRATTGRGTLARLVARRSVKLRASYGTAFRSPSFLDLYGRSAFYAGNPDLAPERARGWDVGVDAYLPGGRGTVSVTWFETRFSDLIASTADFRSVENIQRARTRGLELSARLRRGATELHAAYTWLEADNLTAGTRLLRRPRHRGGVDVVHEFGARVISGVGIVHVAQREDVHARTFRVVDGEDYTVVRWHGSWQVRPRLAFKARLENLLDEAYEDVNGYPATGLGGYAGIEWRF